nr:reverse transcriptase domain-containing protein [Tanacetum cinerariifolium]
MDSRLVANQINRTYVAKEADMIRYLKKVKALTGSFRAFSIKQVPRSENKKADALSKIASTSFVHLIKQLLVKELKEKSISEVEILAVVEEERDTWMTPLFKYLKEGEGLKARLDARSKNRIEELPRVLWAHRTMIKSSNGDTPFSLTYGTEAVIWAEIGMPTLRIVEVDQVRNNEALEINLDLLEERREEAAIREAKSKAKIEKYYNSKVRNTSFKPGDLVYRNNDASRVEDTGKLGPKWEGPYEVTEAIGKGAYKLRDCIARLKFRYLSVLPYSFAVTYASATFPCIGRDVIPKSSEFSSEHYATLVVYPAPFHKYPEPFLCLVGMSQINFLSFIRIVDPTKVRIGERQRDENEPKLLETTVVRVVPLLPVAPDRSSGELEASVEKLFGEGWSGEQVEQGDSAGGGHGVSIDVVVETSVEDVALAQLKRQKKRKTKVADAGEPSHPAKKLRDDYGAPGGPTVGGKSQSSIQRLLAGAMQNVEVNGGAMPTFLFVSSSISTTPEREGEYHTELLAEVNLYTIGAPQSHPIPGGFSDLSGSDFLGGGIRTVIEPDSNLQKVYVPQWNVTNGFSLDDGGVCREMVDEFSPPKFFASVCGMDHD